MILFLSLIDRYVSIRDAFSEFWWKMFHLFISVPICPNFGLYVIMYVFDRRAELEQDKKVSKLDLAGSCMSSATVLGAGQYLAILIAQYKDPLLCLTEFLRNHFYQHAGIWPVQLLEL